MFNRLQKELKNFYVKDANEIVDFSEYFDDNRGAGVAAFSDYFRFRMINKSNVAWVDTDMLCLKEFDLSDYVVITQAGSDGHLSPTTSMLKYPQNSVCAHLWTEMWKGFRDLPAINKDIKAPFNSIYERYKRKHNIYEFLEKLSYKL